jgi:hypothetical protein
VYFATQKPRADRILLAWIYFQITLNWFVILRKLYILSSTHTLFIGLLTSRLGCHDPSRLGCSKTMMTKSAALEKSAASFILLNYLQVSIFAYTWIIGLNIGLSAIEHYDKCQPKSYYFQISTSTKTIFVLLVFDLWNTRCQFNTRCYLNTGNSSTLW